MPRMRHTCMRGGVVPCAPVATRRFPPAKGIFNVFVESCCVHGAHGNGPAFSPAEAPAGQSRELRATGEERPAQHFVQEQEVHHTRSGFAVLAHSLTRQSTGSAIERICDDVRQRGASARSVRATKRSSWRSQLAFLVTPLQTATHEGAHTRLAHAKPVCRISHRARRTTPDLRPGTRPDLRDHANA